MFFSGWFDELDEVFLASHLVIVPESPLRPSRMLLRAMALGVPILFAGGRDAWLRDGKNAVAFSGPTREQWARDILSADRSRSLQQTAVLARDTVRRRHDLAHAATRFEQIIRSTIERVAKVRW
jgi:hypothetical protein